MHADIRHLKELPIAEKMQIIEELWNDIAQSNEAIKLHPCQFNEAERRAEELEENSSRTIDREELWRRVDE